MIDTDDHVLQVNPEFTNLFGYTEGEACGRLIGELIVPEERWAEAEDLSRRGFRGESADLETVRQRKDGVRVDVSIVSGPVSVEGTRIAQYIIYRDITARKRAEQRLAEVLASEAAISLENARAGEALRELESRYAHVNRVSTMGELAASLAHEILHPIATARNNARAGMRFLEMNPPNLGEVKEALASVVRDADRAKSIVGRVRDHIKKAPPRRELFDLDEALREAIFMVQGTITREKITVNTDLMNERAPVQGDRIQLQQVVVNLILNAVEAMSSEEKGTKELGIRIEQSAADASVLVQVRDSGPGIDPANLDRVFEPFYTTKMTGVGMGLSICRSIINGHGGRLWAEANTPRGAVFQFTLPPPED